MGWAIFSHLKTFLEKIIMPGQKIESMLKNMQMRDEQILAQMKQMERSHYQYEGAIGATREIDKIWANLDDKL